MRLMRVDSSHPGYPSHTLLGFKASETGIDFRESSFRRFSNLTIPRVASLRLGVPQRAEVRGIGQNGARPGLNGPRGPCDAWWLLCG